MLFNSPPLGLIFKLKEQHWQNIIAGLPAYNDFSNEMWLLFKWTKNAAIDKEQLDLIKCCVVVILFYFNSLCLNFWKYISIYYDLKKIYIYNIQYPTTRVLDCVHDLSGN